MRALHNRVLAKDPMWKLAGFIVDEPAADIIAIRYAWKSLSLKSLFLIIAYFQVSNPIISIFSVFRKLVALNFVACCQCLYLVASYDI